VIYICIPAHNEERTIGVVLWKIRQVMASFPRDYQILVANDASSDKTADVLAPYQGVLPLSVLHLDRRRGYAAALELLLREASRRADYPKRDVSVTLQADFSDDPEHLTAMLKRVEAGADVVCTNAALPEKATRAARWSRKIGQGLLRRRRWPEGVTDPLSGFRAYRVYTVRKAIEQVGSGRLLTWDGSAANVELLTRVLPHARRTDAFETRIRSDRQQRPTRQSFWAIVGPLLRLATGGAGPFHGHAPESVSWAPVDTRKRRPAARRPQAERSREAREVRANGDREARRRPERPRRPRAEGEEQTRRPRPEGEERPRRQRPEGEERPRREGRRRNRPPAAVEQNGNEAPLLEVVSPAAEEGVAPRKKKRRRKKKRQRSSGFDLYDAIPVGYSGHAAFGLIVGMGLNITCTVMMMQLENKDMTPGLIIALLGFLLWLWGCGAIAKNKQRSGWNGLWGLIGLIGLLVVVSMAPGQSEESIDWS